MPLTSSGQKVLSEMKKKYGSKKGTEVFYASINKGISGSSKWHKSTRLQKSRAKALS